jgi:diguanylate cyclase
MDQACDWMAKLDETDPGLVPWVNVNLSPPNFKDPNLDKQILRVLARHGLGPHRLGIEITENLLAEQAESSIDMLVRLKELGLQLALDDFGTGYSSLSYLRSLPISVIKIAKPFVDDIENSTTQQAFTAAIVALGRALDKFVIAEGIERVGQAERMRSMGCDAGQGYFYSRPMDGHAMAAWARQFCAHEIERAVLEAV